MKITLIIFLSVLMLGLLLPDSPIIPVDKATPNDWNHDSFWHEPWGSSGTHKGIDIFGAKGAIVRSSVPGVVLASTKIGKGGNIVLVLGPKWRIHYYAHLQKRNVSFGNWVTRSSEIGTLGDSGNAKGKQPHVHYSIVSLLPLPWLFSDTTQGWKRMFYLNPHERLI